MNLTGVVIELFRPVPVHRTLGLVVEFAADGVARVSLELRPEQHNVIEALHSSGVVGLVDAAGLAALLSAAPDEARARATQPLGARSAIDFLRPARGRIVAECMLDDTARAALRDLWAGQATRARIMTVTRVSDGDGHAAAEGSFDWSVRLAAST